jgi:hypothetical protein
MNEEIIESLLELNLCDSERDAGRLFGRSSSFLSSSRSRNRNLTAEAIINLLINLNAEIGSVEDDIQNLSVIDRIGNELIERHSQLLKLRTKLEIGLFKIRLKKS